MSPFGLRKYVRACNWKTLRRFLLGSKMRNINVLVMSIYVTPCDSDHFGGLACVYLTL